MRKWNILLTALFISSVTISQARDAVLPFHIVIDPGHGGLDDGAVYQAGPYRITEKQITLQLAQELAQLLKARGVHTTLTRSSDQDLSLAERSALANRLQAQAFISIHTNSSENPEFSKKTAGVETFILNTTSDASSKRLAKIENSVITSETENKELDNLDVARILKDLQLDANLSESKQLACLVQTELSAATQSPFELDAKRNRGVKQALFHVLLGANMPSILVEVGFLNHVYDRSLILSKAGQNKIALSIAKAILEFKQLQEKPQLKSKKLFSECKVN